MDNSESPPVYWQKDCVIGTFPRGFHLITQLVIEQLEHSPFIKQGLLHLFLQHTSASLTISENSCPDVPLDLETHFNRLFPDDNKLYRHILEGTDDMPAHLKNVVLGTSLTIPLTNGRLALGQWQGIFLCEHRNQALPRPTMVSHP